MVADKGPVNIDVQPIAEAAILDTEAVLKPVENEPAPVELVKSDEPVAIPADLDFTPDEALNELVSSDILGVIPEQPAVEAKEVIDEPVKATEPIETAAPEQAPTPAEIVVPAVTVADAPAPAAAAVDIDTTTATVTPNTETIETADVDATAIATETVAAAAVVDEMNVVEAASNVEAESAMEAAPIKADEEQMDVDETNSTDAMDL